MQWLADPAPGAWLNERLDDLQGSIHDVAPRGFAAYARVLHPAEVRTIPGRPMPDDDEWAALTVDEHAALAATISARPARWAEVAEAFGTQLHPRAQWHRLIRTPEGEDWHARHAPDGREFLAPREGELDPATLALVTGHLLAHTDSPRDGFAAVWEGWGGLLGSFDAPRSSALPEGASGDALHREVLARSIRTPFDNVFRKPVWREGRLPREVSEGARLQLPGRGHVLFSASPEEFADASWFHHAPWRNERAVDEAGNASWVTAESPSLIWPADRAWVLVTEIDFDSTIVAGSAALIAALCADESIEALPLEPGDALTWDADEVNR